MKVYSIGREMGCDIVINDSTDVISRRHATLNVYPSGKMTIVDMSQNGTYVNGIKISQNVPVPVTRKDNISFAHIARLDWSRIPDTRAKIIRYAALGIIAILLVIGGVWGIKSIGTNSNNGNATGISVTDTTNIEAKKKAMEQEEKRKQDSIKNRMADSIKKAKGQEKEAKTKHPADNKKKDNKGQNDEKRQEKKQEKKVKEEATRFI